MDNIWNKYKWLFLLFINLALFGLYIIAYPVGGLGDLYLLLPLAVLLSILNYHNFKKVITYILYQTIILGCIFCGGCISTYLFYNNISDDELTPPVGMLIVFFGLATILTITVILSIIKVVRNKKYRDAEKQKASLQVQQAECTNPQHGYPHTANIVTANDAPDAIPFAAPLPTYYAVIDGQVAGPFSLVVLQQMALARHLTATSLIWKTGMAEWASAETIDELKSFINP